MKNYKLLKTLLVLIGILIGSVSTQVWANTVNKPKIYYDNTNTSYSNVSFVVGHDSYSRCYKLSTKISNTNLWYRHLSGTGNDTWGDAKYIAVFGTDWDSAEGNTIDHRAGYTGNKYTTKRTLSSSTGSCNSLDENNVYLVTSDGNKSTTYVYYKSGGYTDLNYTQTLNQKLSTDGGSTFSTSTASIATVTVSSYKLNGATSSTSSSGTISSGTSSTSCIAAHSATVTYTVSSVATGYSFVGWYDGSTQKSTSTTYTYSATGTKTITARFKENTYTVTVAKSPSAGGSVTPTSATAMPQITGGAITATPNTGYTFGGWSVTSGSGTFGSSTSTASNTFKPTANSTITATFNETMSTVSFVASPTGKGTFQVGGATVTSTTAGVTTTRSVTAVPISGYRFTGWSISGGASISSTSDNPTTVTGGGAGTAATLTATFEEDLTYFKLKFGARSGETSYGTVAAEDGSGDPLTSNTDYLSGTSVTVTATATDDDYKFDSWYNAWTSGSSVSTDNPLTFTLTAATDRYAHFVRKTTSITLNKNNGSGGTAGPVTATHGNTTLSTSPLVNPSRSGYTFTGYWTESSGGVKVIDTDGYLVASVSGYTKSGNKKWDYDEPTLTLYAQWTEKMTTVTVDVSPTGAGTLTVGGSAFTPGNTTTAGVSTSRTVVATAGNDFTFGSWGVTGNATGTNSTNTYTLKGNGSAGTGTLTANFTLTPCSLWYSSNQLYKGSSGTKTPMSYDTSEEAYYIDVTTNSSPYYFRFYHNNSKEYSCDWSTYPAGKEVVANGSKVDVDKDVTGWGDHSACYFTGANGSSIRIWFDYQNKKAWITEPGYSVTINNGDHGTVSPNGVRSVGASGLTITATPTEGYKLASWNVTGGAHVASSTSATTTLTATADGTVTAIYETESPIRLYYSNPAEWSTINAYLWDVDNTSDKNANWPGTDITTNIELVDCQQYYYYEYYPSAHAGWDRIIFNGGDGSKQTGNITFSAATNAGQYNNAGKDATGSWQDPTNPWYFAYDGDSYNTTAHPLTCTSVTSGYVELDLAANTDYAFKFVENGSTWYGCTTATKITYENKATAQTMNNTSGGSANQTIKTAVAGTYRFTWDITNKRVTVTYPTSYQVQYSIGTVVGTAGSPSAAVSGGGAVVANNDYVASGTSVTFTAPAAKDGYAWAGWYDAATTAGNKLSVGNANTYTTTVSGNTTVYAVYTENTYNVTVSAGAGGSVSPTGTVAVKQVNGTSLTATPSAGYSFANWTISGGGITPTTSSTSPQTFKATTTGGSIQANFSEIMRTVTVDVNNSYLGSVSTTSLTSVGPATKSAAVTATAATGASFTNWTLPSGVTAAEGYSTTSNPIKVNATAGSKTITANFTETTYTVTLTTADAGKGTVGSNQSVGQITAVQIQATPKSGYMFSKWVKTAGAGTVTYYTGAGNGQVEDASGEEKETTYICVTGNVTLQATWEADRSSGYVVHYGNSGTNAAGGADASQTRPWKDGKLYRATTAASDVSYFTFTAGVGDVDKVIEFKIHKLSPSTWYGYGSYSGEKIDKDISNEALSTDYGNGRLCITMPGSYLFTWNKSNNQLSISYPTDVYYVRGGWDSWSWSHPMTETSPSSGIYTATINMTEANHTYTANTEAGFKVLIAGQYYGKNGTTFTRTSSTGSAAVSGCNTSGQNMGLTTDYTGNYTFTYNTDGNELRITYPTAYKVTYGKGTINGSASNCSAVDIDNSSAVVTSNSTWVKSGNRVVLTAPAAKEGYTYNGWFNNNSGTGEAITTAANCTITVTSAATYYACYSINNHTITHSAATNGSYTIKVGSLDPVSTNTTADYAQTITLAATPAIGYHFGSWTVTKSPSGSVTVTSNQFTMPDADVTVTATFTPNTYRVHFHRNGGAGVTVYQNFTYDVAQNLTANSYTRTGYTFAGWALTTDGAVTYANSVEVSNLTSENGVDYHLYAKWTPNPYAITFDATTNGGALEGESPKNVIFDETSVAECPTATKDGYCFDGWYTKASSGQKVINADGSLVASVTDESQYTGAGGAWKKASATTVYAVYVAPTIEMTPDPTALNSRKTEKDTVVIHQTFSCEPTGNYNVVYTVGYSANHTQLPSQPTIKYGTGLGTGYDTIKMPMDANTYEIVAELRTGSTRGEGTIVKRDTIDYVVEAQYAVTLHYVVDGKNIRESRQVYAYPTSAPSEVRVFMEESGYELDYWEMGVGIDSVSGRWSIIDGGVAGNLMSKYIYAANNGNIYLHYKPKSNTVYFFNTFSMYWYSTIMKKYDYGTSTSYWANTYGAGSKTGPSTGQITPDTVKSTTTDLEEKRWMASIGGSTTNFAFVSEKKDQEHFWGEVEGNKYPKVIYRTDYNAATPMFVPVATDVTSDYYILNQNAGGEAHYYRGFWVKYSPNSDSTGYYLHVYNQKAASGAKLIQSLPLRLTQTGEGNTWELTASMDLEGGKTYGFKITKATGVSTKAWYSYNGTLTAADHEGKVLDGTSDNIGLTTTSAGDYTFHVFCKDFGTIAANNATANQVQGQLAVTVDYATVSGDYRVIYSDATQTEVIASPSIHPLANGQDTVSFFIRKNAASRVMKIQKYTTNWADLKTVDLSSIAKDSVYVLYLQQNEGADDIEVAGYDFYDGDYYIRTDCVDEHKWDYKQSLDNHRMSPSDYGMADIQPDKFTHYYVHWIGKGGNVKFIIANKYAPCLSDTVITDTYANVSGGNLPSSHGANVRFMYNKGTNVALRAYLYGSEEGNLNYLKIITSTSKMGTTATTPEVITAKTFTDEKNWVYQAEIKAKPGLTAKLTAEYDGKTQYFIGSADKEESIIGGTGDAWQQILLTYDFKVNRLICAWQPSGDSINGDVPINADIMIIRVGQEDAQQIIFKNNDSKLSAVKYIYSVMQFNRDDMVGMMPRWDYWSYQHCMYYISFPYDVLVNDIMAPGRMGTEWRIQRYNGAKRAKGWFAGDGVTTFWEDVQAGDTLKAYEGYSLLLNRRIFNDGSSTVWQNKGAGTKLYMYFPSKDATTGVVANKTVNVTVPSHECTLDRVFDQDLGKPTYEQRNHKIVDSHWNMIGTPLFEDKVASTITAGPTIESETLQYIYEWNPAGNVLGIKNTLTTGFKFRTMYSYMAQYTGTITFVGSAVNKIVAATRDEERKNYNINLELTKDEMFIGRTYVELRENAVDSFLLNEDVYMVKNGVSADLYTYAGAYEAGANVLTVDDHIVPVGVDVKTPGTYVFSMPDNFDGEVVLVDNYEQTRTNLMLEDYEIALPKGTISDRFYLEIKVNKVPTAIDGVSGGSLKDGKAHKYIENGIMYILQNGVIYDAQGRKIK